VGEGPALILIGGAFCDHRARAAGLPLAAGLRERFSVYCYDRRGRGESGDSPTYAVAREVARIGLPLSHYTEWYWKVNLHNLLRFLELRMDSHAQYEIRVYAEAIGSIVAAWVPLTWASFLDKRFGSVTLSSKVVSVLHTELAGRDLDLEGAGLSKGEARELREALGIPPAEA
jgi:thymidylate synthase (FAD)